MNLCFDQLLADEYKSQSQKIRVMSEDWIARNMYCPNCGNVHITRLANNMPVADFHCDCCGEVFELKSKEGKLGKKITDGAYDTMIDRITSSSNPDLFILQYDSSYTVTGLMLIPKFFFVPDIIEKRKPLAATARRAGWTGCNILLDQIPLQGRISIIHDGREECSNCVVEQVKKAKQLRIDSIADRGWLFDVLNCVNKIQSNEFELADMYQYEFILAKIHPENNNIRPKIRQQLQLLRDKGVLEFLGRGKYRKCL